MLQLLHDRKEAARELEATVLDVNALALLASAARPRSLVAVWLLFGCALAGPGGVRWHPGADPENGSLLPEC